MKRRKATLAVPLAAIAALTLVAATASAVSAHGRHHGVTRARAENEWDAAIRPAKAALSKFSAEASAGNLAGSEAEALTVATRLVAFNGKLIGDSWPQSVKAPMRLLERDIAPLEADFDELGGGDASVISQADRDLANFTTQVQIVVVAIKHSPKKT